MEVHLIDHPSYLRWVLSPTHPTQGRRFAAAGSVLRQLAAEGQLLLREHRSVAATPEQLTEVHSAQYVRRVLDDGICGEWMGSRPDLAAIASYFFGGTLQAEDLVNQGAQLIVHLPGAKHHAMADHSSGFCVFADFAALARRFASAGKRVACLDIDLHHGDGTEQLTRTAPDILTFSVHQGGLFPGTGVEHEDDSVNHVHNRPLAAGDGDAELVVAVQEFVDLARDFRADVLLLAVGADGHSADPLGSLEYSEEGLVTALSLVRSAFPTTPIVMGGAGGYRPDDYTPSMWVHAVAALAAISEPEIAAMQILNRVHETVRSGAHNAQQQEIAERD